MIKIKKKKKLKSSVFIFHQTMATTLNEVKFDQIKHSAGNKRYQWKIYSVGFKSLLKRLPVGDHNFSFCRFLHNTTTKSHVHALRLLSFTSFNKPLFLCMIHAIGLCCSLIKRVQSVRRTVKVYLSLLSLYFSLVFTEQQNSYLVWIEMWTAHWSKAVKGRSAWSNVSVIHRKRRVWWCLGSKIETSCYWIPLTHVATGPVLSNWSGNINFICLVIGA